MKGFKPRAIGWESSMQFGFKEKERNWQQGGQLGGWCRTQAYNSEALNSSQWHKRKNGQKPTGSGQTKGTLPCGWCLLPRKPPNRVPASSAHKLSPLLSTSTPKPSPLPVAAVGRTDALSRALCLFHLQPAVSTHLFPFSGQFIQHLLSTYLNLAPYARNILHSSSHFSPLQHPWETLYN